MSPKVLDSKSILVAVSMLPLMHRCL